MEDNRSATEIVVNGGQFARNKHLLNRHSFIKQHIENGDITLQYCPTKEMLADMLTKPLPKVQLQYLLQVHH